MSEVADFVGAEMISDAVEKELKRMSSVFPWIDDDSASTYWELTLSNIPDFMENVGLVATKTYTRGLIIISVYYDSAVYFVLSAGEGDQPLLDVRFPDISKHGQGLHIASYNDSSMPWRKLTLWHILIPDSVNQVREIPKLKTLSVSSKNYEQTYCIMKSSWDPNNPTLSVHHDVLFRFGSWCYAGRVQLTPSLTLSDIPFVIPALRMQQSRLDYICEVSAIPTTSPFAPTLAYMRRVTPYIEHLIAESEETLNSLIDRLTKMGLGESVAKWLEGDPANSFFEFKVSPDDEMMDAFKNMELVASKCYHATGIITITIVFQSNIYVCVLDGSNENPLLDSRFPDISGKGRGYQVQAFSDGVDGWSALRKISVWQTVNALEQEFRDRAAQLAQSKKDIVLDDDSVAKDLDGSFALEEGAGDGARGFKAEGGDEFEAGNRTAAGSGSRSLTPETEVQNMAEEKSSGNNTQSLASTRGAGSGVSRERDEKNASPSTSTSASPSTSSNHDSSSPDKATGPSAGGQDAMDRDRNKFAATSSSSSSASSSLSASAKEIALSSLGRDLEAEDRSYSNTGFSSSGSGLGNSSDGRSFQAVTREDSMGMKSTGGGDSDMYTRRPVMARPHHLPKMESLSKRMEEIRSTMNLGGGEDSAPWDSMGRPLATLGMKK